MPRSLMTPTVSIVIPVRICTDYLRETIAHLRRQKYKKFELLVVTDNKENIDGAKVIASGAPGPAYKRNLGARIARGNILAFLDDDSYPSANWLGNALRLFARSDDICGVCGPCLTPPNDDTRQKASGWVWASWLGSGGAGLYRNRISQRREVDDYPSVNLLIRKKDFVRVGGFDIRHWPGEDTKLCLDLTKKLGKKIIYDPGVLVYHHRRQIFRDHLQQIKRYAQRRGFFAKKFPETSFRLGYLMPTIFIFGLVVGGIFSFLWPHFRPFYILAIAVYLFLVFLAGLEVFYKEKNLYLSLLSIAAIFLTHLWYGFWWPIGYSQKDMGVTPHRVRKNRYIGG